MSSQPAGAESPTISTPSSRRNKAVSSSLGKLLFSNVRVVRLASCLRFNAMRLQRGHLGRRRNVIFLRNLQPAEIVIT
jgi:hypothetical protein